MKRLASTKILEIGCRSIWDSSIENSGSATEPTLPVDGRRHDLDALRATAMLLGIFLHALLSFIPGIPWPAQDVSANPLIGIFLHWIHGFRMPLFFLVSGYFTAMLWRKRGYRSLLWHRFKRILIPFVLGVVTIIPLINYITEWSTTKVRSGQATEERRTDQTDSKKPDEDGAIQALNLQLIGAIATGDWRGLKTSIENGADVNCKPMITNGNTPLAVTAWHGRPRMAEYLMQNGAKPNVLGNDGEATPLHSAIFFGREEVVSVLIDGGADLQVKNKRGEDPISSLYVNWEIVNAIGQMIRIRLDQDQWRAGRYGIAERLEQDSKLLAAAIGPKKKATQKDALKEDPKERVDGKRKSSLRLFLDRQMNAIVLHHLWFLYLLCWLVLGFWVYTLMVRDRKPGFWANRYIALFWLVPLTYVVHRWMDPYAMSFGPALSAGWVPRPSVLAYYGVFYYFGALWFDRRESRPPRGLQFVYGFAFFIAAMSVFGFYIVTLEDAANLFGESAASIKTAASSLYAWLMAIAWIEGFGAVLRSENKLVRWISDSSYWLYLAHMPLVMYAQVVIQSWEGPLLLKLTGLTACVAVLLWVSYAVLVRSTPLGMLLNGRRWKVFSTAEIR